MKRIVLDTNVLISGMINAFGAPGRIVDQVREGILELVVDDRILSEYREVLSRPKFSSYFTEQDVRDIFAYLKHNTHYVVSTESITGLPDPDDAMFLEVALAAGAPLVTGNINHYPAKKRRSITVYTPAKYVED